jgi:hypothetical protein
MSSGNPPSKQEDAATSRSDDATPTNETNGAFDQAFATVITIEASAGGPSAAAADQLADNDVLAAVMSVTPDVMTNLEHTFDQLISTTDLFDVPSIDFDGASDS